MMLNRYRGEEDTFRIFHRLEQVHQRWRAVRLTAGAAAVTAVVLFSLLAAGAGVGYLRGVPPAALRWAVLAAILAAWSAAVFYFLVRAMRRRLSAAQTARFVEQHIPQLNNDMINSVLLAGDTGQVSPELVRCAIAEAAENSEGIDLLRSVPLRGLKRWASAAGAALAVLLVFGIFQGRPLQRGLAAVFNPAGHLNRVNRLELVSLTPGDHVCFAGEPVTVTARVVNETGRTLEAQVIIDGQGSKRMLSGGGEKFTCPLGQVAEPLRYAVRIGDSQWPTDKPFYTITVNRIRRLDLTYEYPPYTGMKTRTVQNTELNGDIAAPLGSKVRLTLLTSAPVGQVLLSRRSGAAERMRTDATGTHYTGELTVDRNDGYRMMVTGADGTVLRRLPDGAADNNAPDGYFRIAAVPDDPPRVRFELPGRPVTLAPGGKLAMRIRASDAYGLTAVKLFASQKGRPPQVVRKFPPPPAGKNSAQWNYTFDLAGYAAGSEITYYATATDNRNLPGVGGHQTSRSRVYKILVQDAAKVAAENARVYDELRKRLMALLAMQESQRVNTAICWTKLAFPAQVAQLRTTGGRIQAAQKKIRAEMADIVEKFPFSADMAPIRPALASLAANEARIAIDQAAVLTTLRPKDDRNIACHQLARTQDRIIDSLQTLLAMMPDLANKKAKTSSPTGDDLPPDVREKLTKLAEALKKFAEEERKVIKASERLAKKSVDNFTAEDKKLLHKLQMIQDKWEKFINEHFTDFSKLANQDFSNPVLMKELMSIKSDITMAKDALKKKAVEIATAVEDNGIENAKTLTANIEKWLPDTPDRAKWSMEDPAGDQTKVEQPELPTELEDLVGDLLEAEEDLFDEIDDVTGKYTMSGDKGIGWDAVDGPISNMNAQGVTGNRLPNTSELGGRSGEGRTGKSSGEFVEDKAVGKGGRRTPTRLTKEPFQKGQVKDTSTDPPGGATGGGKLSGVGAEGLEGPVPPPLAKKLGRLAGKQAALINRAERIRANFKVSDHANFKLIQAITLMSRVRGDLAGYRYRNALRSRNKTLGALRQTKLLLSGEVDVTADSSKAMPKYIRDNIADAMKGNLPAQYRAAVEAYYRRLSEKASKK